MKPSFFKTTHFLLVVMTTHLATVVAPDPSQYMKNFDLNKEIANIDGSKEKFDKWDFVKRFCEGVGAGIGYNDYANVSAEAGWNGERIHYDRTKPVSVLFADKGGNSDNGLWFSLQRLIKSGKQFIVHLGRDATDTERFEVYIVEIAGYIEEIVKAGVVFPFVNRFDLIESLKSHITLPDRKDAQLNKNTTVDTETAALMAALKQSNNGFNDPEIQNKFEKLLKTKIEESVDREITASIIEKKFLATLKHYEEKGLLVVRQGCDPKDKENKQISELVDNPTVTATDPDVAPILEFTGGISIDDVKSGAGRRGTTIMLKAVRVLSIMHLLVNEKKATYVRAMDIQSYKSNTVNPDTLKDLEDWQKDLLRPQMHLPVTPNLTIVIGQFTADHIEVDGQKFIQIIPGLVLDTIKAYNPNKLNVNSVQNYTVYRVDIDPKSMGSFHTYETDYAKFLDLIQGRVDPCPFSITKGNCNNGNLTWENTPLKL